MIEKLAVDLVTAYSGCIEFDSHQVWGKFKSPKEKIII